MIKLAIKVEKADVSSVSSLSELIRPDEGLTLETSDFESLYGGQLTLSSQVIKPNYLVVTPHPHSKTVSLETYFPSKLQLTSVLKGSITTSSFFAFL